MHTAPHLSESVGHRAVPRAFPRTKRAETGTILASQSRHQRSFTVHRRAMPGWSARSEGVQVTVVWQFLSLEVRLMEQHRQQVRSALCDVRVVGRTADV